MIFNIDKSRDSNLGTKLEKTPTPQGLELTANPQVTPVVTQGCRAVGWVGEYIDCCIIRRLYEHLDMDRLVQLYKALVRPHLEYGHVI